MVETPDQQKVRTRIGGWELETLSVLLVAMVTMKSTLCHSCLLPSGGLQQVKVDCVLFLYCCRVDHPIIIHDLTTAAGIFDLFVNRAWRFFSHRYVKMLFDVFKCINQWTNCASVSPALPADLLPSCLMRCSWLPCVCHQCWRTSKLKAVRLEITPTSHPAPP